LARPRSRRTLALLAVAALAWPAGSWADDGVLEIDQTCVAAGCFPGDTAGFPVQITESGSYLLTSNLVVLGEDDGVSISADDVSFDLGGFSIAGPVTCDIGQAQPVSCPQSGGRGIVVAGDGSLVRNGVVRGFGGQIGIDDPPACVAVDGAAVIEDLAVSDCSVLGIAVTGNGTVRRTTVAKSAEGGIAVGTDSLVTGNLVHDVNGAGIAARGTVSGNSISRVGSFGIVASGVVESNHVQSAGSVSPAAGIRCGGCTAVHNQVFQVTGDGIIADAAATVVGNTIRLCSGLGISTTAPGVVVGYGGNNLDANNGGLVQVGGTGVELEIGINVCHGDTMCP
jgi:hypothetical protein